MSRREHDQTGSSSHAQELARARADLVEERGHLRSLLDSMIDPYVLLRPLREGDRVDDLLVLDVNPAASGYLDMQPEKLLGATILGLVPDLYGRLLVDALTGVATDGTPIVRDGITVLSPQFGGTPRSYDVRATRVGTDVSLTWRDVTERVMAAEALARSEQRFRLLAENSTDVVFRGSPTSQVEWVSPSVAEVLGFEPDELLGTSSYDLVTPEDRDRVLAFLTGDRDRGIRAYQARFLTKHGGPRWMSVTVRAVYDDGEIVGFVGSARDVETEHAAVEEAQYLATHDELTHLLNRRAIIAHLDAIVQHPPRQGGRTAVLYLDLDGLKPVNDQFGHGAGDSVLVAVARRLLGGTRSSDTVGRLGGDEFVIVLGTVPDASGAVAVAEKLRQAIGEAVDVGPVSVAATASIGIAFVRPDDTTDTVMARADAALYLAKDSGKDRVRVIDDEAESDLATAPLDDEVDVIQEIVIVDDDEGADDPDVL